MRIEPLKISDYPLLCEWWKDWKWTPPPIDILPTEGEHFMGAIVYDDNNTPISSAFLYLTNSKMCKIEFLISNFHYKDKQKRSYSYIILIENLCQIAKSSGYKFAWTCTPSHNVRKIYEKQNFSLISSNNMELLKLL